MDLYRKIRRLLGKSLLGKFYRYGRRLPGRLCRRGKYLYRLLQVWHNRKKLPESAGNQPPLIVSLTTIPTRLNRVCYAIGSILCQTMLPDRIILYLDDDVAEEALPPSLLSLRDYGLEICRRPGNIKAHKKYYYAMTEHPEAVIITVDDDQIYPPDLIEKLYSGHAADPGCVIAARAHEIAWNDRNETLPYREWHGEVEHTDFPYPSSRLLATGVGGVLYPPGIMPREAFHIDLIEKLCLNADDIWLKVWEAKKGVRVRLSDTSLWGRTLQIRGSQAVALCKTNVDEGKNDEQLRQCMEYFHLTAEAFQDRDEGQ